MNAIAEIATADVKSARRRVGKYDWSVIGSDLNTFGCAVLEKSLTPNECKSIASLYPHEEHFRSHIHMARHGFGKGEGTYISVVTRRNLTEQ